MQRYYAKIVSEKATLRRLISTFDFGIHQLPMMVRDHPSEAAHEKPKVTQTLDKVNTVGATAKHPNLI